MIHINISDTKKTSDVSVDLKVNKISSYTLINTVLPMVLAVSIYVLFRHDLPDVFKFFPFLDRGDALRLENNALSDFVIFNLPDALWAYSFGSYIGASYTNDRYNKIALLGGLFFVISLEPVQLYYGYGVFDVLDMVSMILAYLTVQFIKW